MERIFIKIPQQTVDRASPRAEERDRSRFVVPVAFFLFDITVSQVRVLQHWVKMGNSHQEIKDTMINLYKGGKHFDNPL